MPSTGVGDIEISNERLKEILEGEGVKLPDTASVVFGNVKPTDEGGLQVSFAWDDDDSYPSCWADPPEWVKKKD